MTLYVQPPITTEPANLPESSVSDVEDRRAGRTAAASASAPVGTLASRHARFSTEPSAAESVMRANKLDFQIRVLGRSMRMAREIIAQVEDAWVHVTATNDAVDAAYTGLLDGPGPGPGAPGLPGPSPTVSQARRGWFARSLDRLTGKYRSSFEGAINGPWV